jgi:outer membrane protein assembly factor BamB
VLVGSDDGRFYLLALGDGKQLWSYEIGAPVTSSPAISNGTVIISANDGRVYAFRGA